MPAIKVERLSKEYRIGAPAAGNRFQALDGLTFEVPAGETLGIIGRNGAGKSTLLKILSGITDPTAGRVEMRGRVCSLLEVGTGFHPELTGRENIFLNGTLLGMRKAEIRRKFDAIVDFSEIGKFIDTPVKHYSSGMYVRLAFSVAAHLEPEILIVDEVLAVGDARFQAKCVGRIGEIGQEGRTVLVVSHNLQLIRSLCNRVIWLNDGKIAFEGDANGAIVAYSNSFSKVEDDLAWPDDDSAPGNDCVRLLGARVVPEDGSPADAMTIRVPFLLEFAFRVLVPFQSFYVSIHFKSAGGDVVFRSGDRAAPIAPGRYRSVCHIPADLLNGGKFTVDLFFMRDGNTVLFKQERPIMFNVFDSEPEPGDYVGGHPGFVRPLLRWQTGKAE
ncbi:MAG TPA: ABC transporter ATP-binding protein [Candidatus Deferrimicrobiaceae bacterium]|jgi:lipopolysaccharide transport system ATP-binding protein